MGKLSERAIMLCTAAERAMRWSAGDAPVLPLWSPLMRHTTWMLSSRISQAGLKNSASSKVRADDTIDIALSNYDRYFSALHSFLYFRRLNSDGIFNLLKSLA